MRYLGCSNSETESRTEATWGGKEGTRGRQCVTCTAALWEGENSSGDGSHNEMDAPNNSELRT